MRVVPREFDKNRIDIREQTACRSIHLFRSDRRRISPTNVQKNRRYGTFVVQFMRLTDRWSGHRCPEFNRRFVFHSFFFDSDPTHDRQRGLYDNVILYRTLLAVLRGDGALVLNSGPTHTDAFV